MDSDKLTQLGYFAGALIIFMVITLFLLPQFVDVEPHVARINERIEAITGEQFSYRSASVDLFPDAKITFEAVGVKNVPEATANYLLRAEALVIDFTLFDVLFGTVEADDIVLRSPRLELEVFRDGSYNFEFLKINEVAFGEEQNVLIEVENGSVILTHLRHDYVEKIQSMNGVMGVTEHSIQADMTGEIMKGTAQLTGECMIASFTDFDNIDTTCSVALNHPTLSVSGSPRIVMKDGKTVVKSQIDLRSKDIRGWLDLLFGKGKPIYSNYFGVELQVGCMADFFLSDEKKIFNFKVFNSGRSTGKGSVVYDAAAEDYQLKVISHFRRFDYDSFFKDIMKYSDGTTRDIFASATGFDRSLTGMLNFQADYVSYRGKDFNDAIIEADLENGEIIVSNARINTPSNGRIITIGHIVTGEEGLEYDGQVEAYSNSLYELLPVLGIPNGEIPTGIFTQFRSRFNLLMRPSSTIISELRMTTGEEIQISGGVNIYNERIPRLESTLTINNIDMTPFEKAWLKGASYLTKPNKMNYNPYAFEWLHNLPIRMRLNLTLKNHILFGFEGKESSIGITIDEKKLELSPINLSLDRSKVKGRAVLTHEPKRDRPVVESKLNISRLNIGSLLRESIYDDGRSNYRGLDVSIWSREPINFNPLHHYDGYLELRVRKLVHESFEATNIKSLIQLEDAKMHIKDTKLEIWGGKMDADILVDGEVVPGLDISFNLSNAQQRTLNRTFFDFGNIAGLVSYSGKLKFHGLDFATWIRNISGHFTVNARNIFVNKFNLPGIVRAISSVRSVSGVVNAVRLALESGTARLGSVNGGIYFTNGMAQTTKVNLRSPESVGTIEGMVDLSRWIIDTKIHFGLVTLAQKNYPVLTVHLTGPVNKPQSVLNTKMVEAWVARKNQ